MEFSVFLSDVSNSTQRFFVQPNVFQFRNMGEAEYFGTEFGVRTSLTPSLMIFANYTYLNRENISNPTVIFVDTPRHKIYSFATYRLFSRATLSADVSYEAGRYYQNEGGTVGRASTFASVAISGTVRVYKQGEVRAGISNLFDRDYFLSDGYFDPGRMGYVNLRYRF